MQYCSSLFHHTLLPPYLCLESLEDKLEGMEEEQVAQYKKNSTEQVE